MRETLNAQLRALLEDLLLMGGRAERMIAAAAAAVLDGDEPAVAEVRRLEAQVNKLQMDIDAAAVRTVVSQQPVASDVRLVFAATRAAADVERVGDCCCNVAASAEHLDGDPAGPMAELFTAVRGQVGDALAALIGRDVTLAEKVLAGDKHVNRLRDEVFTAALHEMQTLPAAADSGLAAVLISRNLERIGDHAASIAEDVVYIVRGTDIRHGTGRDANGG
jgi:phosphate transport system protein